MSKEINRRDFLKTAAMTGAVLLTGDALVHRVFAQGSVKMPEVERTTITIIEDNYYDIFRPDHKIAKRTGVTFILRPD